MTTRTGSPTPEDLRSALRTAQGPLKERYRSDPASARIPTTATAGHREPGLTTTVDGEAGPVQAALSPAAGGTDPGACSADLLLQALLACAGVGLRTVATAMGVELRSADLVADGWWDARGALGVDPSVPVGVQDVVVTATVDTDADDAVLARLAAATERCCVVGQSLASPPQVRVVRAP